MPFISLIMTRIVQPVLIWLARVVWPVFWSALSRFAGWIWTHFINNFLSVIIAFLSFFGRQIIFVLTWLSDRFKNLYIEIVRFFIKIRFEILLDLLRPFWLKFIGLFTSIFSHIRYVILPAILAAIYGLFEALGLNLFVEIVRYLLLASSAVVGFVIDLIFGLINIEAIIENFNEALNALPPCSLELMFAVGLGECLNYLISTSIVLITTRFILFVFRR